MELRAFYFDGQSPIEREILVIWAGRSFVVYESTLDWSLKNLAMEWDEERLHVAHKLGSESFIVQNLSKENALALGIQSRKKPKGKQLRVAATMFAITLATFIGFYTAIEPISYKIAAGIPAEKEKTLFENVLPNAYLNKSRCTQWDAQQLIQSFANNLQENQDKVPTVEIIDWDQPNAFAFPGQKIFVTQGLLNILERPEHLLAVLAHEQGHVELRHNLGGLISTLTKAFIWSVAFGDFSGGFLVDPKLAKDLSDASYSRARETEADDFAGDLLQRHGHDPKALALALESIRIAVEIDKNDKDEEDKIKFPEWFNKASKMWSDYFSSHPEFTERRGRINLKYPEYAFRETLTKEQWKFLKSACASK